MSMEVSMSRKILLFLCLSFWTSSSYAITTSVDWQTSGNGLITRGAENGLEWLDLTVTAGRSYDDIYSKLGTVGEFDGWRYAYISEVSDFLDEFGGNNAYYDGGTETGDEIVYNIVSFWGNTNPTPPSTTHFIVEDVLNPNSPNTNMSGALILRKWPNGYINLDYQGVESDYFNPAYGSALVRNISAAPAPPVIWLVAQVYF